MTRFVLNCVRQRVLTNSLQDRLEEKLRAIARRELGESKPDPRIESLRSQIHEVRRKKDIASNNLAMAEGADQYKAIASVFEKWRKEEVRLESELRQAETSVAKPLDLDVEVEASLKTMERLAVSAPADDDFVAAGNLFQALNVRLFLDFVETKPKKRVVNVLSRGVVTFGMAPPPVTLYEGPTGRRALHANLLAAKSSQIPETLANSQDPARGGKSLGNISRGERI